MNVIRTTPISVCMDDGTSWPLPSGDLEHCLRYGEPTVRQRLQAAWIVSAYAALLASTNQNRNEVANAMKRLSSEDKT